jgi:hypothetical protein
VTASTTTTIRGVSIFSRQRKRNADVFDIALSPGGIVIKRPGRSEQHMTWERIEQWDLDEQPDCIVLTLRGGGSVTPLMVKGWNLSDLDAVMRDATEGTSEADAAPGPPVPAVAEELSPSAEAASPQPETRTQPETQTQPQPETPGEPAQARASRRQAAQRPRRSGWKTLVTIVLLGALATAVVVVLLQSAGVIDWSFLGPVA